MNREETREAIDVMLDWLNGGELEERELGDMDATWTSYEESDDALFNFELYEYRSKPKPREFWIDLTDGKFIEAGKGSKYWGEENDVIKVREVLSE